MRYRLVARDAHCATDLDTGAGDEAHLSRAHGAAAIAAFIAASSRSFCSAVPVEIRK